MPTTPISPLPPIHPVLNPLLVKFQDPDALATDNEDPTELETRLEVRLDPDDEEWTLAAEYLTPYGLDDIASVQIHRALKGLLGPKPPSLTILGLQPIRGLAIEYRLLARDIVGGVPSGNFTPTDPAQAWLAGRSLADLAGSYSAGKAYRWLIADSGTNYLYPGQRLHFEFLTLQAGEDIKLRLTAHYTDETSELFETSLGNLPAFRTYYINLPAPVYSKPLDHFTLGLGGYFGAMSDAVYYRYKKAAQYSREIMFRNSLGGFQSFVLTGKAELSHSESGDILDTVEYPPLDSVAGHSLVFNQRSVDSLVLRSGWISYNERRALKDMLLHNEVYLVTANQLRKIIITNATHQERKDGEYLYAIEFQARYAYDESARTQL